MTTMVGTQKNFIDAVKELIELDYDAIAAYKAAINNLEDSGYKKKLEEFKADHQRHITELSEFLSKNNEEAPTGPDNTKHFLAEGKVKLASLFGDQKILTAMLTNEEDTNTAYERMNSRTSESSDAQIAKIITHGLEDEKKHKKWIQDNIAKK